jgi:hypothetical protein
LTQNYTPYILPNFSTLFRNESVVREGDEILEHLIRDESTSNELIATTCGVLGKLQSLILSHKIKVLAYNYSEHRVISMDAIIHNNPCKD